MTRRDAVELDRRNKAITLQSMRAHMAELDSLEILAYSAGSERLSRSIEWFSSWLANAISKPVTTNAGLDKELTVAEAFGVQRDKFYYDILYMGEVHRLAKQLGNYTVAEVTQVEIETGIAEIERVSPLRAVPLPMLVGAQALSCLVALQHTSRRRSGSSIPQR
jgi:hypothetical protein